MDDLFVPPEHRKILNILEDHVGADNAIGQAELAEAVGMHPRKVRALIGELVLRLEKSICTRYGDASKAGYYLPANQEEAKASAEALRSHALLILKRAAVLANTTAKTQLMELYHHPGLS